MRRVKIIERPNETYTFAAIDQQTGEIPLQLTERGDLVALCDRLGWVVQEDSQSAGAARAADLPQRIGERHRARRPGNRVRHRQGGAQALGSAGERHSAALAESACQASLHSTAAARPSARPPRMKPA
jgi:hypothetical protein